MFSDKCEVCVCAGGRLCWGHICRVDAACFQAWIINVQRQCSRLIRTFTSHCDMSAPERIAAASLTKTNRAEMPAEREVAGAKEWIRALALNTQTKFRGDTGEMVWGTKGGGQRVTGRFFFFFFFCISSQSPRLYFA